MAVSLPRSEEHTSELQSRRDLVCRLLLEKNHSAASKEKITPGIRMREGHRAPWLRALRELMEGWAADHPNGVFACFFFKKSWRHQLFIPAPPRFLFLN